MSYYDHFWLRILASAAIVVAAYGLLHVLFSFIEGRGRARRRRNPREAPRVVAARPGVARAPLAAESAADTDLEAAWAELEGLMVQHLASRPRGGGDR